MKKTIIKILVFSLITLTTSFGIYAQEKSVDDILGTEDSETVVTELNEIEEEREDQTENKLLLSLPEITDNPNYALTFTDPSADKKGVQLEIDNDRYLDITSPYSLPTLSIGEHTLKFKFTDTDGLEQTLEKSLTIVPRPPILLPASFTDTSIDISGTGLSGSTVSIFVSYETLNFKESTIVDEEGKWNITIDIESQVSGVYSCIAVASKYGYSSDFSEPLTFEIGGGKKLFNTSTEGVTFAISSLIKDPITTLATNSDILIFSGIFLLVGILFGLMFSNISKRNKEDREVKEVKKKTKIDESNKSDLTLREIFEKQPKKEEPKVQTEKVVTKEEFLKEYKVVDPDKDNGKEKDTKRNSIRISLTSKEE